MSLIADVVFFGIAAFLGNYLYGIAAARQDMTVYGIVGAATLIAYLVWRILQLREDRYRIRAFETLSDNLARSAEAYGIRCVYNMQLPSDQDRRNADTQSVIANARAMFLCANSGASYLSAGVQRHYPRIVEQLRSGTLFRVLLLDPLSDEKQLRNEINAVGEANDSKLPLGDIIRLCNQFSTLDVRFVGRGMTCSVFIADDALFFDPYHVAAQNGRIENRFLCLKIARSDVPSGKSYFDLFHSHIEALWRRGTPIDKWLHANHDQLNEQLGIGKLPVLNR
jgi:hypothetical protein